MMSMGPGGVPQQGPLPGTPRWPAWQPGMPMQQGMMQQGMMQPTYGQLPQGMVTYGSQYPGMPPQQFQQMPYGQMGYQSSPQYAGASVQFQVQQGAPGPSPQVQVPARYGYAPMSVSGIPQQHVPQQPGAPMQVQATQKSQGGSLIAPVAPLPGIQPAPQESPQMRPQGGIPVGVEVINKPQQPSPQPQQAGQVMQVQAHIQGQQPQQQLQQPQPQPQQPPQQPQPVQTQQQLAAAPSPQPFVIPAQPQPTSGAPLARKYEPPHLPNTVATSQNVEHLEPEIIWEHLQNKTCILVDVRGDDRAAGLIEGAVHVPAIDAVPFPNKVPKLVQEYQNANLVVFTCQYSAHRAPQCANWYREKADGRQRVGILSGGFRGWEGVGLPVQTPATAEEAKSADAFAMSQGVRFVKHYGGIPLSQIQQIPQIR